MKKGEGPMSIFNTSVFWGSVWVLAGFFFKNLISSKISIELGRSPLEMVGEPIQVSVRL